MKQYHVTGMSCAACAARVEKAVSAVPEVTSCAVNLLTNSMGVEGNAPPDAVIAAVVAAGYGASPKDEGEKKRPPDKENRSDREAPHLLARLLSSIALSLALMYVAMGHVMWGLPLPAALTDNPVAIALVQLLLCAAVMVINQKFFISGVRGLLHGAPNMDTLVALGSSASFGWSVYVVFSMSADTVAGNVAHAAHRLHDLYFESAAMILVLITVGKLLEARAKGKTTDALRALLELAPPTVTVLREGREIIIPVDGARVGDKFILRAGDRIPLDGTVIEGGGAVDESALTGESIPADKAVGDAVSTATTLCSGYLVCEAVRVGEDTTLANIVRMVSDAAATKAPIAKVADRVAGVFVPVVMLIAAVTVGGWLIAGEGIGFALARGIAVLVISCPCALGLATPVAIMVGNGVGAKHGILFKTAASLEEMGRIRTVVLDKTGTVTHGEPRVTDIIPAEGVSEHDLLTVAYSLEVLSEHPLARAITAYGKENGIVALPLTKFSTLTGIGIEALDGEVPVWGGKQDMAKEARMASPIPDNLLTVAKALSEQGKTPLYFARGGELLGMIAVADVIRSDSPAAIHALRALGLRVILLSGDNESTARAIGAQVGVDEVIAGVLPDGKEAVIRRLQQDGRVAMVGDGINDAPALTAANVGVAIGAGADVAIDAADVVLMGSRLSDVVTAVRLSRATLWNIRENLFWAFVYNVICIPLAAGLLLPLAGLTVTPMIGAAAMSLSSLCVVTNALRLNLFRAPKPAEDNAAKIEQTQEKEKKTMEKILKIEGMMCPHCEAHVKKALEAIEGVATAAADHKSDTATVTLTAPVTDEALTAAVEDAGYKVLSIR